MQPTAAGCANKATSKVVASLKGNGKEVSDLPPLQAHHVVLGRYLGSKTKPLNEATRIYRDVRKTTKRTKHFLTNEIAALKQFITKRARTELKNPSLPDVTFVVDIHKAEDAGKLDSYLRVSDNSNLMRTQLDCSRDEIIFVQDQEDHFLKADLDSKKRPGKAATVASDGSVAKKRKQEPPKPVKSSSNSGAVAMVGATSTSTGQRLVSPLQSMDSSGCCGASLKSSGGGAPSVITTTTIKTDASSLSDRTSAMTSASVAPAETPTPEPRFQLQSSQGKLSFDDLEEKVHQICEGWIRQEEEGGLEAMLRKASLVQSLQTYCGHYKRRLQHNPLGESPIPMLRALNEDQFVAILNTLGNCMLNWYDKYPSSCLEGETNAWTGITMAAASEASEVDDYHMEQGSIGTYSSLELELPSTLCTDDGVSDIVQCFEEFSMGSSTRSSHHHHHHHHPAIRNEWSPVVRDQQPNYGQDDSRNSTIANKPLPPRWSKSRQLFQKQRQHGKQGHQFLQKQFRRFRNKSKSSSSSKKSSSSVAGGSSKATAPAVRECSVRVSTKEELSLLYRRLRHNDPALKEAIVDFAIAQQEAKELIRVLGLSFYDWDMRRCCSEADEERRGKAFIVLKRSESSDWEDASK